MDTLQDLIRTLISLSLAGLVFAVGLHAGDGDLLYVLRRPGLLLRSAISVLVLPPVIAGILVAALPLEPAVKAGIMLMAISPVPPLVPGKELGVGGRKEYAYGLYMAMVLLTLISVPVVFSIATRVFGREDNFSSLALIGMVFVNVVLPLIAGVVIRRFFPGFAERAWSRVYKISMIAVFVAFVPVLFKVAPALWALIGNGTVLAMAAVTAAAIAVGHALGGPDLRDRATLATASAVRHPGIATMIAGATFADPRVSAAILLFLLVGLVVSAPYAAWIKRTAPPVAVRSR